jgi:hypothetical protein
MHWTKLGTDGGVRYDVQLEDDTEVDLVQADGRWKLGYSTSAAEDWSAVDLGSFHNEGELLIAADDRLADLLEWPELAQETTLLRRQSRQVGSIGDSS